MNTAIRTLVLLAMLSIGNVGFAQQDVVGLTDFPAAAWPANGVVPGELKDKYVFIDLAKNEYIVAYPENLGSETFEKTGPGALKIVRLELLRNVQPVVALNITQLNGKLRYAYSVANAEGAKQSLDQWSLIAPNVEGLSIKGPDGWFALTQKKHEFKVKDPQWIKTGGAAVWSFRRPEQVIKPGDKKAGFELDSDLRPGFTLGYFRKAESIDVSVGASGLAYPPTVKKQVEDLLRFEYNSKTVAVIGPKWDKNADDKTIASDFITGIDALTKMGTLSPTSDFAKAALEGLKAIQSSGSAANMKNVAAPKTPAETDIFNAMKISLHLN